MSRYDDIINLPHPEPKKHTRMSRIARAAQFGAFRALTGHEEAIEEVSRLTDTKVDLDEYEIEKLNEKLLIIYEHITTTPEITVTYFEPDSKKSGGANLIHTGRVQKIDEVSATLIMCDKTHIPINMISDIQSELFNLHYGD